MIAPSKILLVPLRFVGDMVLTLPMADALKQAFPQAVVGVLASKANASLAHSYPSVDEVLTEEVTLAKRYNQLKGWDVVISLRQSWTLAAMARLAGASTIVGFDRQRFPLKWLGEGGFCRTGWFLDAMVPYPSTKQVDADVVLHQVAAQWQCLKALGLETPLPESLMLFPTAEDERYVASLLDELGMALGQKAVLFHGVSASTSKAIPLAVFSNALQVLHQQGVAIIATGTTADRPLLLALQQLSGVPLILTAGQTTLRQVAALAKHCQRFVGVDSGPLHVAAASGVRHFTALYGPTNPKQWGPYGNDISLTPIHYDVQRLAGVNPDPVEANRVADALAAAI